VGVFVGHEFSRKGLSFAIRGLAFGSSALLMVIGGNDDIIAEAHAEAVEHGVGDRVLFLGVRKDLPNHLAASDFFVFPSAYEANALVVLEALASGLPVIATPVGFAPEVIRDGVNGYLVERDPEAVGARMEELATLDDESFAALRRGARASAEGYGWREVARRYLALVEELHAERSGRAGTDAAAPDRASG
jgi:UDP-glucose:(heptosyl)LPS alpha-1,3-glucosyltransferase